jgi:hypothetical protein
VSTVPGVAAPDSPAASQPAAASGSTTRSAGTPAGSNGKTLSRFRPPAALSLLFVSTFDYWNAIEPLTDAQWARIEPLVPDRTPKQGAQIFGGRYPRATAGSPMYARNPA